MFMGLGGMLPFGGFGGGFGGYGQPMGGFGGYGQPMGGFNVPRPQINQPMAGISNGKGGGGVNQPQMSSGGGKGGGGFSPPQPSPFGLSAAATAARGLGAFFG